MRSLTSDADLQRHLIPGLLGEHGLTSDQLHFPAEAILLIADGYTREVGFAAACLSCFQHNDCKASANVTCTCLSFAKQA